METNKTIDEAKKKTLFIDFRKKEILADQKLNTRVSKN
jgi:hypothetical protein